MNKVVKTIGAAGASLIMSVGMAGAASANAVSVTSCNSYSGFVSLAGMCGSSATDYSRNYIVSGNGSAYIRNYGHQSNTNSTTQVGISSATNSSAQTGVFGIGNVNLGYSSSGVSQTNGTSQGNVNGVWFGQ